VPGSAGGVTGASGVDVQAVNIMMHAKTNAATLLNFFMFPPMCCYIFSVFQPFQPNFLTGFVFF
jgi:hypothetical protein